MKALVLADCGAEAGLGHLRRCLVLAAALRRHGLSCRLLLPSLAGAELVRQQGHAVAPWPKDPGKLPTADLLVADTYQIGQETMVRWGDRFPLRVVIDDLADRPLDAEVVLNGNLFAEKLDYGASRVGRFLLGPGYAMVDENFAAARRPRSKPATPRALVSFSGTDNGALAAALCRKLLEQTGTVCDLVVSPLRPVAPVATRLAEESGGRCHLHHGAYMPDLMSKADVFAGAAGSVVLECAAANLPMVVAAIDANKQRNVEALTGYGVPAFPSFDAQVMASAVVDLLERPAANPLAHLVDGKGGARAANEICTLLHG